MTARVPAPRPLPNALRLYVRAADGSARWVGGVAMYLIFVMVAVLLLDAVTRNVIDVPLHWCIEFAQFTLAAYYFAGGAETLRNGSHVRMDLLYSGRSERGRAWLDLATVGCLLFYLVVMLIGSWGSLSYAIATDERRFSIWNPSMIPIKAFMLGCLALMLLQAIALVIKNVATLRGLDWGGPAPSPRPEEAA